MACLLLGRLSEDVHAARQAKEFYQQFVERVRAAYQADRVKDGVFGAMMNVSLVNDVSVSPPFYHSPATPVCTAYGA